MSRRRAVVAILLALTFVLPTSTGEARDRKETCDSYTAMTGTTTTECRRARWRSRRIARATPRSPARRGRNADEALDWRELASVRARRQAGSARTRNGDAAMNTRIATIKTARYPARIPSSRRLLAVSAVTYLALAIFVGVHAAFYLVIASALIALWVALCRRFPVVGILTLAFVSGLLGGLFGYGRGHRRW